MQINKMLSTNNICIVLHIRRQKNSKIVLLLIKNTSKFLTSLLPLRLSSNICLFLSTLSDYEQMFFFADTPQKADEIHQAMFFSVFLH